MSLVVFDWHQALTLNTIWYLCFEICLSCSFGKYIKNIFIIDLEYSYI